MQAYSMVLVHGMLVFLMGVGLFTYRYIYPKKQISVVFLLVLCSLLPVISIFRPGVYESGDLVNNIYRTISLSDSIKQGIFLPWWAANLNATYGYPLFIFVYPLPYYWAILYHFIGFSFILSFKLVLVSSFLLSGLTMYICAKEYCGKIPAVVATVFYLYAPYHLIDIHFRTDSGETVAFVFMPLIFWAIRKMLHTQVNFYGIFLAFSVGLLLLSHQATSLFFIPLSCLFGIVYAVYLRKSKEIITIVFMYVCGVLLSAFYVFPLLSLQMYTHQHYIASMEFISFWQLLYTPWRWGFLFQGHKGELGFLIGYVQIIMLLFAVVLLYKKKFSGEKKFLMFTSLAITAFLCFMMLGWSKPLWYAIPLVKNFQFTYRLLGIIAFFISFIVALCVTQITNKKILFFLCFFAIIPTILNWGNRGVIPTTDAILYKNLAYSSVRGEGYDPAMPMWTKNNADFQSVIPAHHLEVLLGNAKIEEIGRSATMHEYVVSTLTQTILKENTLYFPGWRLYANKRELPMVYTTKKYPGIVTFTLPKGLYYIQLIYKPTVSKYVGILLSLLALSVLVIYFFQRSR